MVNDRASSDGGTVTSIRRDLLDRMRYHIRVPALKERCEEWRDILKALVANRIFDVSGREQEIVIPDSTEAAIKEAIDDGWLNVRGLGAIAAEMTPDERVVSIGKFESGVASLRRLRIHFRTR